MPVKHLFLFIGLLISTSAFASGLDSIGVESLEGKKIILHQVEAKETYYSLGRKYGVNPAAIIDFNRNVALNIGMLVKIPTQRPADGNTLSTGKNTSGTVQTVIRHKTTSYKVKPKETLYSIAKKFNVTVEDIKAFNKLKGNALSVGQILKIRSGDVISPKPEIPVLATKPEQTDSETSVPDNTEAVVEDVERRLPAARYGLKEIKEKGVATWIQEDGLEENKMLALHPTAPIGTIIKITNPMTQKSTFAKVVGKFTENESTKGVIIILTKSAADLIGALDKRFQVNLVYGVPDEQ